ncbi:MAG: HAD-IA family hydrolase [Gemmatimonadales bacterium]
MPLDFGPIRVMTFDCFGTLVDWETGILSALRPIVAKRRVEVSDEDLLSRFARAEAALERGSFRRYRSVLELATLEIAQGLGFTPSARERQALARSLPGWPLFADTNDSLARLAQRFELGIISNVDDDLFAPVRKRLGAPIRHLMTAERARSYKPARNNFLRALAEIGRPWGEVLHLAQSLYHDVAPARSLGLATVWIDRRGGTPGGATPPSSARPDLRAPNLRTLADLALGPSPETPRSP